jgi:serine/threonine protein kinase
MDQNPGVDRSMWVRVVDRFRPNDHADCLVQLIDVAKGLKYMHGLGLVHGDLKSVSGASHT